MKLYTGLVWRYEYGNVTKRFLLFIMNKKITKKKLLLWMEQTPFQPL